ncbi:MAG: hypothetical protein KY438_08695, partial [Actinobacteria bacterium]|nr:hypothetical protein [Actinomycetota bacterium]
MQEAEAARDAAAHAESAREQALGRQIAALEARLQEVAEEPYRQMVGKVRRGVLRVVPRGATVAVISRGDPELLELGARRAVHVPGDAAGDFAGGNPADD